MLRMMSALVTVAALSGCMGMPPEGTEEADLVAFDDAVASVSCDLVTEADYLAVELQTGLMREQVQQIASYRVAGGDAVKLDNGGMRLTSGRCAPLAETTTMAAAG